jgi:hypothetical protein
MKSALSWMPCDSLRQARATRPIDRVLADWSAKWFVTKCSEIVDGWEALGKSALPILRDTGSWLVSGDRNAILRIARGMLSEADRGDFTPADLRLLRRIGGEALDDLAQRLDAILPRPAGNSGALPGELWVLRIGIGGQTCLELSLDRGALSEMVRQTYSPEMQAASLDGISIALGDVAVPVTGRLGSASLELEQVVNLEPGDILVLDQLVDEPVALVVAERNSPIRCVIAEAGEAQTLTVYEPI